MDGTIHTCERIPLVNACHCGEDGFPCEGVMLMTQVGLDSWYMQGQGTLTVSSQKFHPDRVGGADRRGLDIGHMMIFCLLFINN